MICLYPARLECVPDVVPHSLVGHLSSQLLLQCSQHTSTLGDRRDIASEREHCQINEAISHKRPRFTAILEQLRRDKTVTKDFTK